MTRTMERTPAAKMSATARMPARLQRKCACGGTPASSGECEKCKTRSEAATRHPIRMRKQLAITSPGDAFEMEADRAAQSLGTGKPAPPVSRFDRHPAPNEYKSKEVPGLVHEVLQSSGQPLDRTTREFMSKQFGHDFGHVTIHTDAPAIESARAVNANAYTVGNHLVFGAGRYSPNTHTGKQLLAHELAHVLQQNSAGSAASLVQRQQSTAWYPTFTGCSPAQDRRLDFQITFARTRVEQTISALQDFLTEKPSRVGIITGTESGLLRHFGTSEPAYVKRIITGLGKILARLRKGSQNWRCADATQCQKICRGVPFACASPTIPVTFCPPHFAEGDGYGTMILIHETGHQAGFAFHTYDPIAARTAMQPKDIAITSSDSFASLVDDLSLGGPRIPGAYSLREKVEGARQEVEEKRRRPAGGGR